MANSSNNNPKSMPVQSIRGIVLIGCGGTGSFLAEHLCRMIAGFRLDCKLMLCDGDNVEKSNIWRQNFAAHEVGANKAAALSLRLSGRYGIVIETLTEFVTPRIIGNVPDDALMITATDTLASRRSVAEADPRWWLDVGNEQSLGQAILGTTHAPELLRRVFWTWHRKDRHGYVSALPDITAINPAILTARKARKRAGCGQMPFAEQGFGVNAMAALAAAQLAKQAVVDGVVYTAAIYFDAASGRMSPRRIDRELFQPWMRKEKNN